MGDDRNKPKDKDRRDQGGSKTVSPKSTPQKISTSKPNKGANK